MITGRHERRGEPADISKAKDDRVHGGRGSDIVAQGAIRKHREGYDM